ncbi:MAG: DUF3429 family protein [Marinicaulis sp.]|nr:DUF3429 family protein [Marinicaulis sp.]
MQRSQKEEMTRLGLWGLLPFIAGAVALWISPIILPMHIALDFHQFALVYGGVTVAYLAGTGAGAILTPKVKTADSYLPGQLITLVAFFAIVPTGVLFFSIGAVWRHAIILLLLVYLLMRDNEAVKAGLLPRWYGALRMRLTFWAGLAILLIISRLLLWGFY